jgi:hypothetical protein
MNPNVQGTDYAMWKLLAWCGPIFMAIFFFFWGVLAKNMPPAGADLNAVQIAAHYLENNMAIRIGMSVCMVGAAFYMAWGCAVSKVMRRIEGPDGILSSLEMMGATITVAFPIVACGCWLTASMEATLLPPEIIHMLYFLGWMIIDLAYMVTTFQIFAVSIVFLRDRRSVPLMPAWVSWWGFFTCAVFFPVSLIPFFRSGPFAFHGLVNFWIAFFAWYVWVTAVSYYTIVAVSRLRQEDGTLGLRVTNDPQSAAGGLQQGDGALTAS